MYRSETLTVRGSPMEVLVFEPEGPGPFPGLVVAQHLPVAHAGLTGDPFTMWRASVSWAIAGAGGLPGSAPPAIHATRRR